MIQLYNTLTRKKEPLTTHVPGQVAMYVCGPTVYNLCHIGNARPAVIFDTVRRYLEHADYAVTFISNITDIDDKIIARANELGITTRALTSRYLDEYEQDMAALGVRSPTIRPKATEHINEMIELVRGLEEKGVAYATPRGVWFDVTTFADYGKLSGRVTDGEDTEHRVEQDPEKKHPQDFALWKTSKPGEPAWDSPWGMGRPGWHLECSAMGGKYAGFALDIHGGGVDLCFPHHENEIAQSEAYSGKTFVRHWLHNGFVTVPKEDAADAPDVDDADAMEKMGKSKGNAFVVREALTLASGAAIRLWILGTHYRAPLLYKTEFLAQADNTLERFYNCLDGLSAAIGETVADDTKSDLRTSADAALATFTTAMDDDFNTPQALAALHELVGVANGALAAAANPNALASARDTIQVMLGILGLPRERPNSTGGAADGEAEGLIDLLVQLRDQAREDKNFALSDTIRDALLERDIEIRDGKGDTKWARR